MKGRRGTIAYLEDMLDPIDLVDQHRPSNYEEFLAQVPQKFFVLKMVEIIGEAAFKLDQEFKALHPEIPWRNLVGTRHILVHDYFNVSWDIIWDIAVDHLPPLRNQVVSLLESLDENPAEDEA